MARLFTAASSQYFSAATTPITSGVLTMAGWFKPSSLAANGVILGLADSGSSSNLMEIYFDKDNATLQCFIDDGSSAQAGAAVSSITSTSTWYHVCGRRPLTSSLDAAVNGTFGTQLTGLAVAPTVNAIYMGVQRISGALSGYLDGALAEVGLWNAALTNDEVASLAAGYSPLFVRPQSLVAYWPLNARATNEEDWVGGYALTNNNGATSTFHPRVIYPRGMQLVAFPAAQLTNYFPGSDIAAGGWTTSTGSGTLASMIDESTEDDSDYIKSALNPSADLAEVKFLNVQTPNSALNHTISYAIKGDAATNITVSLVCNTTVIKTWTHSPAPTTFTRYDQTLTSTEAGTISDYSNLRLRITAG